MLCNRKSHSTISQLYFKNKQTHRKKRSDLWLSEEWAGEEGIGCRWSKGTNLQLQDKSVLRIKYTT